MTVTVTLTRTELALELQELTDLPLMECKKALVACEDNLANARQWLLDGKWRSAKLITWDQAALTRKTAELIALTGKDGSTCREALMNAGGHVKNALKQLQR